MKIIECFIIAGFLVWGWMKLESYFGGGSSDEIIETQTATIKKQPALFGDEDLFSRFENHKVVGKNDWSRGSVVDGVQVYTVRKEHAIHQSIWHIGKDIGVMVVTPGNKKMAETELAMVLNECHSLAKVMTSGDSGELTGDVSRVLMEMFGKAEGKKGVKQVSHDGIVYGQPFHTFASKLGDAFVFSCSMDRK